jgi:hypothetical protein
MKIKFWDVLSILGLISTLCIGAVVLMIFVNPRNSINPFPPPTAIPTVDIPTSTPTMLQLPATWTPTLNNKGIVTLAPSQTPFPTNTSFTLPTYTLTFTATSTASNTPEATFTPTQGANQAQEISQSPSDGSSLDHGSDFDLVWEVKNIGTNDWSTGWYYEYQSGVEGSGEDSYHLSEEVDDGETIKLIVDMIAPNDAGNYSTTWALKNSSGDTIKTFTFSFSVK